MHNWIWMVTAGVASFIWLLIGYFSARAFNAADPGRDFDWNYPVETITGRVFFGIGILMGGITTIASIWWFLLIAFTDGLDKPSYPVD